MTDSPITINVPPHLYERARQLAEETARPVEDVLLERLESALAAPPLLPPDEQAELDALTHLSDDALWTIAREQMPSARNEQMQTLMDRNNMGQISDDEYRELQELVEQGHRLMLRKAQAALLLKERGYDVPPESLQTAGE
jgi:hypothetical protein